MVAIAVTIAGSDSGGGAGIQADLKTFSALGVYGASVITALTAQNTQGVFGIHDVPPEFVRQQIDVVFTDLQVAAVKIGMLSRPATIEAVAVRLARFTHVPVVLDPVMVATSGDKLLSDDAIQALREGLIPKSLIITPNLPEAAALLRSPLAASEDEMGRQARLLLALGSEAVLLKGGHGTSAEAVDILARGDELLRFAAPRTATRNTHGTGCTLSSAIAAGLAKGLDLLDAVEQAKQYVTAAIQQADKLKIGTGHGPVHHFHSFWTSGT